MYLTHYLEQKETGMQGKIKRKQHRCNIYVNVIYKYIFTSEKFVSWNIVGFAHFLLFALNIGYERQAFTNSFFIEALLLQNIRILIVRK